MSTPSLVRSHSTWTWLLLMAATGLTYWLADRNSVSAHVGATAAVLIAGFKARLVFLRFMDLRDAPLPWRLAFEAWVAISVAVILAGYWSALR